MSRTRLKLWRVWAIVTTTAKTRLDTNIALLSKASLTPSPGQYCHICVLVSLCLCVNLLDTILL